MNSLSSRITLYFVVLGTVLLGLQSFGILLWCRDLLQRDLARSMDREAGEFRQWILRDYREGSLGFPEDLAQDLTKAAAGTGSWVRFLAPDGAELYASPAPFPAGEAVEHVESFSIGSRGPYRMMIGRSHALVDDRLHELAKFMVVLSPAAIALLGLFGWVVLRRTLAPIDVVRLEAEQISRTNVSHRIEERWSSGEIRDLIRTFNAMLARLESAFEDLSNFANDAAHELRTPLATLRAEIDTAIRSNPTLEGYEEMVRSFQSEVSRMNRVVTDLFMLAKLDRGQYAMEMETIRLAPLIKDTIETWDSVARARGGRVTTDGRDAEVRANAVALRRVLMNLVENAVKYNRENGEVAISIENRVGTVAFRVRDTGIGIAPEHLGKIFQRFFRVGGDRSRQSGGAGLGLAICKSFVTALGGSISVESSLGSGSTFTVELPAVRLPERVSCSSPKGMEPPESTWIPVPREKPQ